MCDGGGGPRNAVGVAFPGPRGGFEGGVQCEWTIAQFYIEIKIDLDARKGNWVRFDENSDFSVFEDEEILNLDDPSAWAWMAAKIRDTLERAE